jgi:hypothetical protein
LKALEDGRFLKETFFENNNTFLKLWMKGKKSIPAFLAIRGDIKRLS